MAAVLDTRKLTRRLQESGVPDAQADAIVETVPEVRATDVGQLATKQDVALLKHLITRHVRLTGSTRGQQILENWSIRLARFWKVAPKGTVGATGQRAVSLPKMAELSHYVTP